jgi:tetratricopeptide (TPR) repeat protein
MLEQSVVALRNALSVRSRDRNRIDKNRIAWLITQNNLAAALQALGEHEEDIGSLEASIPAYEAALQALDDDSIPLVRAPLIRAMILTNRASAMCALAAESDYLDMAEASVGEFEKLAALFDGTEYTHYYEKAQKRIQQARELTASLQV